MKKDRIVFFANGDFAIDTFELLVKNGTNIVGLVTSANDKVKFHKKTIRQVAEELRVPYYMIKGENFQEDTFFIDWLKRMDADIFCVISFKKLSKSIIKLAKKCAFNVHASILPFLRGAAPINWAIRLGYKETGLTAFVLSDKIDQGDIIANTKVKIAAGEKYTTLFKKLSDACIDFTEFVVDDVLQRDNWNRYLISQPLCNTDSVYYSDYINEAPKIDTSYFKCHWSRFDANRIKNLVDSVNDIGFKCAILTDDENGKPLRFDAKIFEVEVVENEERAIEYCQSDGKTYIKLNTFDGNKGVLIKKIQLAGKKVMDIADFLNGFRYFRENDTVTIITDLMTADSYERDCEM